MAYRADVLHLLTRYKRCHMVGAEAHHLVENFHPARHGVRRVHRKRATQDVPLHARKPRVDELPRRNTPGDVRRFHLHHVQVRTDLLVAQNRARFIVSAMRILSSNAACAARYTLRTMIPQLADGVRLKDSPGNGPGMRNLAKKTPVQRTGVQNV